MLTCAPTEIRESVSGLEGGKAYQVKHRFELPRKDSVYKITLVASNARGSINSQAVTYSFVAKSGNQKANRFWIVTVGINNYKRKDLELLNAEADANAVREAFEASAKHSGIYLPENIRALPPLTKDVTKERLEDLFNTLSARAGGAQDVVEPQDTFILFMAGHGRLSDDKRYSFLPQDYDEKAGAPAIDQETLLGWFQRIQAERRLILLDTCSAGTFASRDEADSQELARIAAEHLRQASGYTIFAAANGRAFEGIEGSSVDGRAKQKHGVFTRAILNSFVDATDRTDGSGSLGFLDVVEFMGYVKAETERLAREYLHEVQKPQGRLPDEDYPIGAFLHDRPLPAKYTGIGEAREGEPKLEERKFWEDVVTNSPRVDLYRAYLTVWRDAVRGYPPYISLAEEYLKKPISPEEEKSVEAGLAYLGIGIDDKLQWGGAVARFQNAMGNGSTRILTSQQREMLVRLAAVTTPKQEEERLQLSPRDRGRITFELEKRGLPGYRAEELSAFGLTDRINIRTFQEKDGQPASMFLTKASAAKLLKGEMRSVTPIGSGERISVHDNWEVYQIKKSNSVEPEYCLLVNLAKNARPLRPITPRLVIAIGSIWSPSVGLDFGDLYPEPPSSVPSNEKLPIAIASIRTRRKQVDSFMAFRSKDAAETYGADETSFLSLNEWLYDVTHVNRIFPWTLPLYGSAITIDRTKQIIAAFKLGSELEVRSAFDNGRVSASYSLKGFAAAINALPQPCKQEFEPHKSPR
jgi:hypothetical protein